MDTGYEVATHQPMIKVVQKMFKPLSVLEIGIGLFSTPLFLNKKSSYLGIENNGIWIDKVKSKYPKANIIKHDLLRIGVKMSTPYERLTPVQRVKICEYYTHLEIPDETPRLLFVDGYRTTRRYAIDILKHNFDFIIYHDCEKKGYLHNRYGKIDKKGFTSYYLISPLTWTCLLIKDELDPGLSKLCEMIAPFAIEFMKTWKDCIGLRVITEEEYQNYNHARGFENMFTIEK